MFQALSNALSGLYAQKAALDVVAHNIANANTEGYSRQRVEMSAVAGSTTPAFFSTGGNTGRGVQVDDISRLRDAFLEARGRLETSSSGYLDRLKDMFSQIEGNFGEPSDNGLQSQLSDFWSAWDDVASNPTDPAVRSQLVEMANTLTGTFQRISTSLTRMQDDYSTQLKSQVTTLNNYSAQVAALNNAIKSSVAGGLTPNDLMDQRDAIVMKMAELAPVTVSNGEMGMVNVFINGNALVRDNRSSNVEVDTTGANTVLRLDVDGDTSTPTGPQMIFDSGDIGGLLQAINTEIPNASAALDNVANTLITTVNTQHALGLDLGGNAGGQFFDSTQTGAANITVLAALATDPSLVAARSATASGSLDGENARLMAELFNSATGPDMTYRQFINTLGVQSNAAARRAEIQTSIKQEVDQERTNTSAVSLDEEMANLIQYQHAYDAAAKMVTVVDEALRTLVDMVR